VHPPRISQRNGLREFTTHLLRVGDERLSPLIVTSATSSLLSRDQGEKDPSHHGFLPRCYRADASGGIVDLRRNIVPPIRETSMGRAAGPIS